MKKSEALYVYAHHRNIPRDLRYAVKKGLQLVFDMTKDDPDCNPEGVWSALLIEFLTMHGLQESGCQRIQETLKKRDEDRHRNS